VIGGDSQDQANANAQLALNQFAEAQLEAGNIVCDIFLAMIWGGNGLFGGVNQLGTNNYPQLSNTANLTATFTPNSGASDSFICLEVHHTAPTSQTFTGESIGHLVYNGPGFNGNLHIVVTCTGSFATNWAGRIKVYTPGATSIAPDAAVYYLLNATFAGNQLPNGTVMDIPFTVPSTGGVPIVIAVDIQGGNNTSGATANQSWQLSGTVSVVP
jgi:VCBS repeat-containing protein